MYNDTILSSNLIEDVKNELPNLVKEIIKSDLDKVILYGSCARGDYTKKSDVDIAVIAHCTRIDAQKYGSDLIEITLKLSSKYLPTIVNFICLPYDEYMDKKSWYSLYQNIDREGVVLYGQ
jgi:predicted nucleotidyltransferase